MMANNYVRVDECLLHDQWCETLASQLSIFLFFYYVNNLCVFEKLLSKHMQVAPYFEDLLKRNIVVQLEFEFNDHFKN